MKKQEIKDFEQNIMPLLIEKNYLKIALESYLKYNHRARLDIADLLYQKYLSLPDNNAYLDLKKNLIVEMLNKLMQALEDSALLAIMFTDTKKAPFRHFIDDKTTIFYNFFIKARRGLSDRQILRMYGLDPADELLNKGLIKSGEKTDFQKFFDEMLHAPGGEVERWKKLGKLYTQGFIDPATRKRRHKKSNVVAVYHNIKHGYKVLLPTDLYKKIWNYDDKNPYVAVVEGYKKLSDIKSRLRKEYQQFKDSKVVIIGTFPVTKDGLIELYKRIHPQVQTMRFIAEMQFNKIDDLSYPVREIRFAIYKSKPHKKQLKHYHPCPCNSGRKYKKCHSLKDYGFEDLIFKESSH